MVSETCTYSTWNHIAGLSCNSGECIRERYFCNDASNCNDTSDESFCEGKEIVTYNIVKFVNKLVLFCDVKIYVGC